MRVKVTPMRQKGRNLHREAVLQQPKYLGDLRVDELRDPELGRPIVYARLTDMATGIETDVLPQLGDARLLWAAKDTMRLAGFERIEGTDYAQTWSVELN
jgi:hypothetical protein